MPAGLRLAPPMLGALLITVAPPAAADPVPAALTVRVYGASTATESVAGAARRTLQDSLQQAGIAAEWARCDAIPPVAPPAPAPGPRRCDRPLASTELSVRLIRMGLPDVRTRALPLGYSLIDARLGRGTLATIDLDRVEWLARAAHADAGVLLGLAIAHEVGHLLLGTIEHADTGVMRARWSALSLNRDSDWRFTSAQAARMRAAVAARAAAPPATTLARR